MLYMYEYLYLFLVLFFNQIMYNLTIFLLIKYIITFSRISNKTNLDDAQACHKNILLWIIGT